MHSARYLPISVVIVTKNEAAQIADCLKTIPQDVFNEIILIDSSSDDQTTDIAKSTCPIIKIVNFNWNRKYPKKRQWALDTIGFKYDWVLFIDADERLTPDLIIALRDTPRANVAGFFIRSAYTYNSKVLKYGLKNNKIALINRRKMHFPVIDDLSIDGMGEIEGHYQPVLYNNADTLEITQLSGFMVHYALDDIRGWDARHKRYAQWEAEMTKNHTWPDDPVSYRNALKVVLRRHPHMRAYLSFVHSYFLKLGFLDGKSGFYLARSRFKYYRLIAGIMK